MNRRNFLKMCTGAAVAVAVGMELFKKDIVKFDPYAYMGDVRFKLHAMYDGVPPYDLEELKKAGMAWRSNAAFRTWNFAEFEKGISCPPTP